MHIHKFIIDVIPIQIYNSYACVGHAKIRFFTSVNMPCIKIR